VASPSSSPGPATFAVTLYDPNGNKVAVVDLPMIAPSPGVPASLPPVVLYAGAYYAWSNNVFWRYTATTPFAAQTDQGAPVLSVVCNPQT